MGRVLRQSEGRSMNGVLKELEEGPVARAETGRNCGQSRYWSSHQRTSLSGARWKQGDL